MSRIHPANLPLLRSLPRGHPALEVLEVFATCRQQCVGRELTLDGAEPIDQQWFSTIENKLWRFSDFAYKYLSFDLILDGWLIASTAPTESEKGFLATMPKLRGLLSECHAAAIDDKNTDVVLLVEVAEHFFNVYERAVRGRTGDG